MMTDIRHASDCAVHNMPAFPNGPCSCGAGIPNKIWVWESPAGSDEQKRYSRTWYEYPTMGCDSYYNIPDDLIQHLRVELVFQENRKQDGPTAEILHDLLAIIDREG